MLRGLNPQIVGASLVGLMLVAGAFTVSRFSASPVPGNTGAAVYVTAGNNSARAPISVGDRNDDGIEDWKEPFLTAQPVILTDTSSTSYTRENTLTEQLSINFMEGMLLSRSFGASDTDSNNALAKKAAERAQLAAQDAPFTPADIITIDTSPELVRTYGNTAANIITKNDIKDLRNELLILEDALNTGDQIHLDQITAIADMYALNSTELRALPVPEALVNEHLGLINAFNTLAKDIYAMSTVQSDPVLSLLRLQRYQADAAEMARALRNMHLGLSNHSSMFTINDPALLFSAFSQVQ